ncbi:MAG: C4-dicarboxylate ABC transporter, partial [Pseudomonadota bacterium]
TSFAAVCVAGTMATGSMAQDVKYTMSHYLPPVLGLHVDFLEPSAKELEEKSGGRIAVDMQTGCTSLGVITKQWDQTVDGISDIAFGLHGIPRGRFTCTQVVELPWLTDSVEEENDVL